MKNFIISGATSGLGRFLKEHYDTSDRSDHAVIAIRRSTAHEQITSAQKRFSAKMVREELPIIIHCAATSKQPTHMDDCSKLVSDNILLTEQLLTIPHSRFIFLSTIDVYEPHLTAQSIDLARTRLGLYGASKLFAEALVNKQAQQPLILRCSSLIGPYMRANNLLRILGRAPGPLSLAPEARLNLVSYLDIVNFLAVVFRLDLIGTFDFCAATSVQFADLLPHNATNTIFGSFNYQVGHYNQLPASKLYPGLTRTSLEILATALETNHLPNYL